MKGYVWPVLVVLLAVIGLSLGFTFDAQQEGYAYDPDVFPVDAVAWMEDHPRTEYVQLFHLGGYLLYEEWPDELVFIDGQTDF